jgi:hypothetical protein
VTLLIHYIAVIMVGIIHFLTRRDSSVGIATGYRLDDRGSIPGGGWEFFSSTPCPDRFWGPPSLISNGYRGLSHWVQSGRCVKLTTHLHLVPRSKNALRYTSTPLYVFVTWCLVKRRHNFTFAIQRLRYI